MALLFLLLLLFLNEIDISCKYYSNFLFLQLTLTDVFIHYILLFTQISLTLAIFFKTCVCVGGGGGGGRRKNVEKTTNVRERLTLLPREYMNDELQRKCPTNEVKQTLNVLPWTTLS